MFGTIRQARTQLHEYRTDKPHSYGRTKAAIGGVLIADGLVGLENPLDDKKSRPGIFGALITIAFGVVFVAVGYLLIGSQVVTTDSQATGTITNVHQGRDSDGDRSCSVTAGFTVEGQEYVADSEGRSSGNCDKNEGDEVDIDYLASDPSVAKVHSWVNMNLFKWIFTGVGLLLLTVGTFTFLVRFASIVFGTVLLIQGRRTYKKHPATAEDDGGVASDAKDHLTAAMSAGKKGLLRR